MSWCHLLNGISWQQLDNMLFVRCCFCEPYLPFKMQTHRHCWDGNITTQNIYFFKYTLKSPWNWNWGNGLCYVMRVQKCFMSFVLCCWGKVVLGNLTLKLLQLITNVNSKRVYLMLMWQQKMNPKWMFCRLSIC